MGEENRGVVSFLITDLILLIFFLGLILIVFDLTRYLLIFEIILTFLFVIFAFISLIGIYYSMRWGWVLLSIILAVSILDVIAIKFLIGATTSIFLITLIIGLIGFILSVAKIKRKEEPEEPESEVEEETPAVLKTYTPGKVIASKTGNNYHTPKCDWAKKIKKGNQRWFDSEEEAKKEGLKPHSCLK